MSRSCGWELNEILDKHETKEKPSVSNHIARLFAVAAKWQQHNDISMMDAIEKAENEITEWRMASEGGPDELDELGDVVVCVLRALHSLEQNELEFLTLVMEMKLRRTGGGVKDKEVEAKIMARFAKELLGKVS